MNDSGKLVIEPKFENSKCPIDGPMLAEVNGKYGYINQAAAVVIEPQFDYAEDFREGLAIVQKVECGGFMYVKQAGSLPVEPRNLAFRPPRLDFGRRDLN